jgi:eukaryotic-like serine/threonine-protein kinase
MPLSFLMDPSSAVGRLNRSLQGRYRISRELGEGGMATVYLARDERHNRPVALKVLKPEIAAVVGPKRFLAEIETTAGLRHPHILPLFDSGQADGFLFYVMPYVEGETLQARIALEKQLPVNEALGIATAVAAALQTAHEAGVVHRDVKPANVLLGRGGPLVADFGIALALERVGGASLTGTGLTVGTPGYMSPEQATGDEAVGPHSDIFALGCVLYEMLVGEPPYRGATAQAILGKLFLGPPVSAASIRRSIPAHVDAAIRKALERLPADRFQTAADFAAALADSSFRYGEAGDVSAATTRRWQVGAVAAGFAALALALVGMWGLTRPAPPAETLRLSILLPQPVAGNLGTMALSRDGSILVYEGPSEEASHQLWVRRWSESNASPLPGTATGLHPSFSPDGREIAYMDRGTPQSHDNRLMITSLEAGVPRVLHEPIRGYPHWGRDGFVYYMDVETGGISRIPEDGGSVQRITERLEGEGTPHYNPYFVTKGNAMLFVVNVGTMPHIRSVNLSSGEITTLVSGGVRPHVTSSGHLVYLTPSGELTAAPFDAGKMTLTGAAVPVSRAIQFHRLYSPLVLSESGTLLYATARSSTRVQPVWVDRNGAAVPIDPEWGFDSGASGFSLSPDGTRLAVSITEASAADIWVKELPRGPLTRLTASGDREINPRWTRDGRVTYIALREGPGALYARPGDGTGSAELLLSHERQIVEGVISADGGWLIARIGTGISVAGSAPGRDVIGIRPGHDAEPIALLVTNYDEKAIMLSPDGRWLAYESDETGRNEIYVRPFPDVDAGKRTVSVNGGVMPLWSRSGDRIFYVNAAHEMVEARVSTAPSFAIQDREILFSIDPELWISKDGNYTAYDISPDDERFLMLRLEERETRGLILVLNWLDELKRQVPTHRGRTLLRR